MPTHIEPLKAAQADARTGSVRDRSRDATRDEILNSALEVFCERTFAGARVPDVAARAGVAAGTIYNHFESKEALVNAVYRHWKRMARSYRVQHDPGMSVESTFYSWWQQMVSFYLDNPLAFRFLEMQHHSPYLDDESLAIANEVDKGAQRFFTDGQARGAIKQGDPNLLISMVVGVFVGLVKEITRSGTALDERAVALGARCAWDLIREPAMPADTKGDEGGQ